MMMIIIIIKTLQAHPVLPLAAVTDTLYSNLPY